jgi:hypothetical protein
MDAAVMMTDPISARSVSWWSVAEFVAPLLAHADSWPIAGTPAWCALPAEDPLKWLALFDAARHHALRMECAQEALADAATEISKDHDWRAISQEISQRRSFYAARPYLKRIAQ